VVLHLREDQEWTRGCLVDVAVLQGPSLDPANAYHDHEVDRLVTKIARDAHAQTKKNEIRAWVEDNLVESDEFAIGESLSFLAVHHAGIPKFKAPGRTPQEALSERSTV
jgi:hypothetical protein